MIGALISALFDFILNLVATAIQIVVWPLNQLISSAIPDLAQGLAAVSTGFSTLFSIFDWVLALVPPPLLWTFAFCYGLRLAVTTISISTHTLVKVWNVFQKIKFW